MKTRTKQLLKFMFVCRHKGRYYAKLHCLLCNKLYRLLDKRDKLYQYQQATFYYIKMYSYLHHRLINLGKEVVRNERKYKYFY